MYNVWGGGVKLPPAYGGYSIFIYILTQHLEVKQEDIESMVTGAPEMCQPIIKNYLDGSLNGQQATKTAICLRILSSDAAVSDFLLPEIASEFLEGLNSADGGLSMEDLTKLVKLLEETAIELSEFLICFQE